MRLQDKVCIITGGAAGIGQATARRFAAEGARIALCDLNEAAGQALAAELGSGACFYTVNVAERAPVQAMVDDVVARFGRVDVLVNNAGILRDSIFVKMKDGELVKWMDEALFDQVMAVNVKGVFNCAQAVAPHMIRQNGGVILNAASVVALYGNFGQTSYVASKAGVIGMTRVWARELGRYNIRVNAVAPGVVQTEMVANLPGDALQEMLSHTPLGRLGRPEDIANAYLWLASDEASFVTGAVISVDGGLVMGS